MRRKYYMGVDLASEGGDLNALCLLKRDKVTNHVKVVWTYQANVLPWWIRLWLWWIRRSRNET